MQDSTLILGAVALVMVALIPIAFVLQNALPRLILRRAGAEQAESKIAILFKEAKDIEVRVKAMTARRNQLSSEQVRQESDVRKTEKAITDLFNKPPLFVHEIGEARTGISRYRATVEFERASTTARVEGEKSQVNPVWRHVNVADVWATNMQDARVLLDAAFPFKLGYTTQFQGVGTQPVSVVESHLADDAADGPGFGGGVANDIDSPGPAKSLPRGARLRGQKTAS